MEALSTDEFAKKAKQGTILIDTRSIDQLKKGFIKGSILIPSSKLAEYIRIFGEGIIIGGEFTSVLLICSPLEEDSQLNLLHDLGIKSVNTLQGGYNSWINAGGDIDMIIDVEADELMMDLPFDENLVVADIRSTFSFANGHLKDAINLPLLQMIDPLRLSAIEDKDNLYLTGDNDEDAFLAASILKKQDIHNLRVVAGGWEAIAKQRQASIVKEPGVLN